MKKTLIIALGAILITGTAYSQSQEEVGSRDLDQPKYCITAEVGKVSFISSSLPKINDNGQVAAGLYKYGCGLFLWTEGKRSYFYPRLGPETDRTPFFRSRIYGLNNYGQIVGESEPLHGGGQPFLLENIGQKDKQKRRNLSSRIRSFAFRMEERYSCSETIDINDHGDIVGWFSPIRNNIYDAANPHRGFVLWENGEGTLIGVPDREKRVRPIAINNLGHVAVNIITAGGHSGLPRAHIWKKGKLQDLGTLGGKYSFAYDISDSDEVVGTAQIKEGYWHACLWRDGKAIDLDAKRRFSPIVLEEIEGKKIEKTRGYACAINTAGQVVGFTLSPFMFEKDPFLSMLLHDPPASNASVAFLWQDGVMYDLNRLIPPDSEWFLQYASGINSRGQIVATGQHKGIATSYGYGDQRRSEPTTPIEARYLKMESFKKGGGPFVFVLEPVSEFARSNSKNNKKALLVSSSASPAGEKE